MCWDGNGKFCGRSDQFKSFGAGASGIGTSRYNAQSGVTPRSYSAIFQNPYYDTRAAADARRKARVKDMLAADNTRVAQPQPSALEQMMKLAGNVDFSKLFGIKQPDPSTGKKINTIS